MAVPYKKIYERSKMLNFQNVSAIILTDNASGTTKLYAHMDQLSNIQEFVKYLLRRLLNF